MIKISTLKNAFSIIGFLTIIFPMQVQSQEMNPFYQSIVNNIDFDLLEEHLQTHEDFGVKQPGTEALNNSFEWIRSNYESWGYTDISVDTFMYSGSECYNLIITKTGTHFPDEYVIIDGHYDSRNGPGTNDNGTGTAIVLESARLLKDIDTKYSVRFIHFSAEEYGLIGSRHYVQNVVIPEDHNIRLVFNIDEVGGVSGMTNNTIVCERDESYPNENNEGSALFTDTLAVMMELYSDLNSEISYAYATDYVPFMEEGYLITGLFEANESPYTHSPNDLLSNMDLAYFNEVTKGAVAAGLYYSGAYSSVGFDETKELYTVSIYPNPVSDILHIQTQINENSRAVLINQQGQQVLETRISDNAQIDMSHLSSGLYFLVLYTEGSTPIMKKVSKID